MIIDIIYPEIRIQTWMLKNPPKYKLFTIKSSIKWHQNENDVLINKKIKANAPGAWNPPPFPCEILLTIFPFNLLGIKTYNLIVCHLKSAVFNSRNGNCNIYTNVISAPIYWFFSIMVHITGERYMEPPPKKENK